MHGIICKKKYSSHPFIMGKYSFYKNRKHFSVKPTECPYKLTHNNLSDCKIQLKEYRYRKTGPDIPLSVFECLTHGIVFTVYPTGYTPYARASLFNNCDNYNKTLFEAAFDASNNNVWRSDDKKNVTNDKKFKQILTLKTQKRHILGSFRLLMLSEEFNKINNLNNQLSFQKYGISYLELNNIRARDGPYTYKKCGTQVMNVLNLKKTASNIQLLKLGAEFKFFGECHILPGEIKTKFK